jgi:hypothetical protein
MLLLLGSSEIQTAFGQESERRNFVGGGKLARIPDRGPTDKSSFFNRDFRLLGAIPAFSRRRGAQTLFSPPGSRSGEKTDRGGRAGASPSGRIRTRENGTLSFPNVDVNSSDPLARFVTATSRH